ncbi:MAG: Bug family tripartite tricarboxylate transporter substrate binding protein [Xanthobacteraceae bacterium]
MKLPRRDFLRLAIATAVLSAQSGRARARGYPSKPVRFVVGAAAGSTPDILARLLSAGLSERLSQQIVVENRPGAGGNVGAEMVARSPSDGYTILLVAPNSAINAALYDKNFIQDIAPIVGITRVPLVMEVHPSVPATTVLEFLAYAKANPGRLNFASPGKGTTPHIAGELFNMMAGVDMVHVPYRGGGLAVADLIAGQVQASFDTMPTSIEHIRAGKLRALAVTTKSRSDALPNVPTVGDFLPGFEAGSWFGIGAPKGTPAEIVDRLNAELGHCLAYSSIKARLAKLGGTVIAGSATEFGQLIADETDKWRKVIKFAGIKPE